MKSNISQKIMQIIVYSIYPLLLIVVSVILVTYILFGEVKTDVQTTTGFLESIVGFSVPLIISFGLIPFLIEKFVRKQSFSQLGLIYKKSRLNLIQSAVLVMIAISVSIIVSKKTEDALTVIISFIFVALCEEFYCRGVLYNKIEDDFGSAKAIILNSLIFSFIYHSGGDIFINTLLRLPLAIGLSVVRFRKKSIYDSILLHYIYNILVGII